MLFTTFSGTGLLEFVSLMDLLRLLDGHVGVEFSCGCFGADFWVRIFFAYFWVRIFFADFVMTCADFGVRIFSADFLGCFPAKKKPEKST